MIYKAGHATNPDYPQGSGHGRGILQYLAENPTTNSQYPDLPWQGQPNGN
jgi:hypothetical protein